MDLKIGIIGKLLPPDIVFRIAHGWDVQRGGRNKHRKSGSGVSRPPRPAPAWLQQLVRTQLWCKLNLTTGKCAARPRPRLQPVQLKHLDFPNSNIRYIGPHTFIALTPTFGNILFSPIQKPSFMRKKFMNKLQWSIYVKCFIYILFQLSYKIF